MPRKRFTEEQIAFALRQHARRRRIEPAGRRRESASRAVVSDQRKRIDVLGHAVGDVLDRTLVHKLPSTTRLGALECVDWHCWDRF